MTGSPSWMPYAPKEVKGLDDDDDDITVIRQYVTVQQLQEITPY